MDMDDNFEDAISGPIDEYSKYLDKYLQEVMAETGKEDALADAGDMRKLFEASAKLRQETIGMCKKIDVALSESLTSISSSQSEEAPQDNAQGDSTEDKS